MKRILALLLLCSLLFSTISCQSSRVDHPQHPEETVSFTDSLGRQVQVPAQIDRVALSGPMAQIVLFALCPDKLVGVSSAWSSEAERYLREDYFNMPEIGQLYGGKGEMNLETLLASGAQIIIDVGEPKKNMVEELDAIQQQTGIPFVHISAYTDTTGEAYRTLGKLLNMEEEANLLADYCERIYAQTLTLSQTVKKANILYITGQDGRNVVANGSFHNEIISLLANNLAVVENPSHSGDGNQVDMEQILLWDPDVILFDPISCYETVATDPAWQDSRAVQSGRYYEVPAAPYNWMGFPPSVQRCLGMLWMGALLYPDNIDYDLYQEVAQYYRLFYHCDLTQDMYADLVANSVAKETADRSMG